MYRASFIILIITKNAQLIVHLLAVIKIKSNQIFVITFTIIIIIINYFVIIIIFNIYSTVTNI
jgi:hypothetical protein